ncbi:hypothetical protein MBLNU230_g4886t1 [Neophaeotheca triangularis]
MAPPSPHRRLTKRNSGSHSRRNSSDPAEPAASGLVQPTPTSPHNLTPAPLAFPSHPTIPAKSSHTPSPLRSIFNRFKLRSSTKAAEDTPILTSTPPSASRVPRFSEKFDDGVTGVPSDTTYSPSLGKALARKAQDTYSEMVGKASAGTSWSRLMRKKGDNKKTESKGEGVRRRAMLIEQREADEAAQQTRVTRSQGRRAERASESTGEDEEPKGTKEQSKDWLAIPQALKLRKKYSTGSRSPSPQATEGASKDQDDETNETTENMTPRAAGKAPPKNKASKSQDNSSSSVLARDMANLTIKTVPTSPDPLALNASPAETPTSNRRSPLKRHRTSKSISPVVQTQSDAELANNAIVVNPPRINPTAPISELWTSPLNHTSRPITAWGWMKKWTCCTCAAETMVEQKVCAKLDCGHVRCDECKLIVNKR